jgi:predicted transcriptional regulator
MVGLTRETVSLEMKKLEQQGLIAYKRGNITIKNIDIFRKKTQISENYDFTSVFK